MHGEVENSLVPRAIWVLVHLALVNVVLWILFGGGILFVSALLGVGWAHGDLSRRGILMAFSVVLWARMTFTALYLLRRRFGWAEMVGVVGATVLYQLGFSLCGVAQTAELGWLDAVGVLLFVAGSYLNTGSELQRKRFKDDPRNKGKLYTEGLFSLARHINYFGDTLWLTGWALLTRNMWAAAMPIFATCCFVLIFIPQLTKHLRKQYGPEFDEWSSHTRRFVPFLY